MGFVSRGCALKPKVIISSLDVDFSLSVRHILQAAGFSADLATGPIETIAAVGDTQNVGLIADGRHAFSIGLCRALKENMATSHVRIVALVPAETAHHFEAFLSAGVEEVFMRPVEPDRYLRALERLLGAGVPQLSGPIGQAIYRHAGLVLDIRAHRISYDGHDIHLGPIEFAMLHQMMGEPTRVFRRGELLSRSWPQGVFVDPKTVDVHIGRLRRALSLRMDMDIIRTVRGIGYGIETGIG